MPRDREPKSLHEAHSLAAEFLALPRERGAPWVERFQRWADQRNLEAATRRAARLGMSPSGARVGGCT